MGLADAIAALGLDYGSAKACQFARAAAAAVYFGAADASARASEARALPDNPFAGAFPSFAGSPSSRGVLQPDLWAAEVEQMPRPRGPGCPSPADWDTPTLPNDWETEIYHHTFNYSWSGAGLKPEAWADLRERIRATGIRNAYLTAYMPTATTAAAVGANESFEPFTSNFYTRRTAAGEFAVVNPWLVAALGSAWTPRLAEELALAGGSVAGIADIPAEVRRRFRTARELPPHAPLETAAAMAPFVCQSISLNAWLVAADLPKIIAFLLRGWRRGLKTGMYYCHTSPAAGTQRSFAAAPAGTGTGTGADTGTDTGAATGMTEAEIEACRRDNPEACQACAI
jgi:ribonucleotide reductase alpha subunit